MAEKLTEERGPPIVARGDDMGTEVWLIKKEAAN